MKFTQVEKIPNKGRRNGLQQFLQEFYDSKIEFAKVEFKENEYVNSDSCCSSLQAAIKRSCLPIKVISINKEIFLINKDMTRKVEL